ncbi:MAG: PIN domain-containing protein [Bacteroidota bacterium]
MIYLVLDTNIWLYLANGYDSEKENHYDSIYSEKHFELLKTIRNKVANNEFRILINEVILNEWERNKHSTKKLIEYLENKQKEIVKYGRSLKHFLTPKQFIVQQDLVKSAIENLSHRIEANRIHIRGVEDFLKRNCIKIHISGDVKDLTSNLAIAKKEAPFQRDKNNFADAVILFSAIEYLRKELFVEERRAIFVSNNYRDFAAQDNLDIFHPDLKVRIDDLDLTYQRHLTKALDLGQEMQDEIEEYILLRSEIYEEDYFSCQNPSCDSEDNYQSYGYLKESLRVVGERESFVDPNQLKLFKLPEIDIRQVEFTKLGSCFFCNTIHVKCPECNSLMCDWDDLNMYYCRDCDIAYVIRRSKNENDNILLKDSEEEHFEI